MLAKAVAEIPRGASYEPKWDGFRSIIFRDGDEVEIGSPQRAPDDPLLPEVVDAVRSNLPDRCVVDGEIVVTSSTGSISRRCNSASTRPSHGCAYLAEEDAGSFVAFDLLALGDSDLTGRAFVDRGCALEVALARARATDSRDAGHPRSRHRAANGSSRFEGAGLDGWCQAARWHLPARQAGDVQDQARADRRLRRRRLSVHKSGPDAIGSLLLGLYTDSGELASVGVIGAFPLGAPQRALPRDAADW
jgi:ATP-dependent DNA ligase